MTTPLPDRAEDDYLTEEWVALTAPPAPPAHAPRHLPVRAPAASPAAGGPLGDGASDAPAAPPSRGDSAGARPGGRGPQGPGGPGGTGGPRRRPPGPRPNYALRRTVALALLLTVATVLFLLVRGAVGLVGGVFAQDAKERVTATAPVSAPIVKAAESPEVAAPKPSPTQEQGEAGPADKTEMVRTIRLAFASMSPKSIVASGHGLLFAQNMMYHHSVSVFAADGALLKTIPDSVDLSEFGVKGHPGTSQGAPVEVAFTPDGKYAWVSNYSMYGEGFGPEGLDSCRAGDGTDTSFVYRIDTQSLSIDKVVPVGSVPKYVAVTPDGKTVLVTNWCSWDLSVIDAASGVEKTRIDLGGKYPRGIAVAPDSAMAYVALMGSQRVVGVDLGTGKVATLAEPGNGPRHLVASPDGAYLYVSNNTSGTVVKIDRATGETVGEVRTGSEPRSMAISADGLALYVVNYGESTMSKVATADMTILQSVKTDASPIGITYEPTTKAVWVACYGGSLLVYDDSKLAG